MKNLLDEVSTPIDEETRLLAAMAYGEASTADDIDEISGIAHAVMNRSNAWGKRVSEVLKADPNYTYAADGTNVRFNLLMSSAVSVVNKNKGMTIAVNAAKEALAGNGFDPSNGAYWWDGPDLKLNRTENSRIKLGFKYGNPSHNIYGMKEVLKPVVKYWQIRNKKTGALVNSTVRGRFDSGYISTAAHGKTIFWRYNPDYVNATGCKAYR